MRPTEPRQLANMQIYLSGALSMENTTCLWEEGGRAVLGKYVFVVFFFVISFRNVYTVEQLNLKIMSFKADSHNRIKLLKIITFLASMWTSLTDS